MRGAGGEGPAALFGVKTPEMWVRQQEKRWGLWTSEQMMHTLG